MTLLLGNPIFVLPSCFVSERKQAQMMLDQKGFPAVSKMHTQPNGGKFPASIQPAHLNEESLSVCGAYIPIFDAQGTNVA